MQGVAAEHVHGDADADAHPGRRDLLESLQVHLVRLAGPAQLLGIRHPQHARLAEQGERVPRELPGSLRGGGTGG